MVKSRSAKSKSVKSKSRRVKRSRQTRKARFCAARPLNREAVQWNRQKGGMAPFDSAGLLLDGAVRVQAQVDGLDRSVADLSHVIPKQNGGRLRKTKGKGKRKSKGKGKSRSRKQRGGHLAEFGSSYDLGVKNPEVLARFGVESTVNSSFGASKGAQD